jgi:hypothetical protein
MPIPRRRTAGKIAKTTFVNQVVDYLSEQAAGGLGQAPHPSGGGAHETVVYEITGAVTDQGGIYTAKIIDTAGVDDSNASDLQKADLGTESSDDDAEVWSPAEIGSSGHALATGTVGVGRVLFQRGDGDGQLVLLAIGGGSTLPAPTAKNQVLIAKEDPDNPGQFIPEWNWDRWRGS